MFARGQIYIFCARLPNGRRAYKIGITSRTAQERLDEIRQNGRTHNDSQQQARLCWYFSLPLVWTQRLEQHYHKRYERLQYSKFKGSGKSEWFALSYPWAALLGIFACWSLYRLAAALFLIWQCFALYLTIQFFFYE